MEETESKAPHVVLLPTPGIGHLIPLGEFAKQLAHDHGFSVTLITISAGKPSKAHLTYVESLPKSISSIQLPPAQLDDLPPDAKLETRIFLATVRSLPHLHQAIKDLAATTRLVAFVGDLFGTDAFDMAREFGAKPYIFFTANCMCLSLFLHLPQLDKAVPGEYRDMKEPLRLPGCVPVPGRDLVDPVHDRKNDSYLLMLGHCRRYKEAEGIFVNSFLDLEPGAIRGLKELKHQKFPPVYPIGPVTRSGSGSAGDGSECSLKWLEEQPVGSVIFVSFGSGGTLTTEQLRELAMGLEMSRQRFLWVVRTPNDAAANSSFFNAQSQMDPLDFLPVGFLDRTKGIGLVVPSWGPQVQVLAHSATGGFLTHCGWNSTLESVAHGVPLVAWPLYAEQKMNSIMLVEELRVAVRPKSNERGVVEREEVARLVKELMEGEEGTRLRGKMRELKECAARALHAGGSSYKALTEVISDWRKPNLKEQ